MEIRDVHSFLMNQKMKKKFSSFFFSFFFFFFFFCAQRGNSIESAELCAGHDGRPLVARKNRYFLVRHVSNPLCLPPTQRPPANPSFTRRTRRVPLVAFPRELSDYPSKRSSARIYIEVSLSRRSSTATVFNVCMFLT